MDFYKNKCVLITGGEGFIGTALAWRLRERGAMVVKYDTLSGWDVTNLEVMAQQFEQYLPHVVFHLAAETEVVKSYSRPWRFYHTNVQGTLNLLSLAREHNVNGIVIASSDKCYGNDAPKPYEESQPLRNNADPYSCSKRMQDDLCHEWGRLFNLPIRVLRCANTYGPGQKNDSTLITGSINRLLAGDVPKLHHGMEDVIREWLYIDDAVEAYLLAGIDASTRKQVAYYGPGCFAYNVGSGECWTVMQVASAIAQLVKGMCRHQTTYLADGVKQIGDQTLNSTKFRSLFPSWTPTPFLEGLKKTIAWHMEKK